MDTPLKLFLSYSHQDKSYKEDFLPYLRLLSRKRNISIWVDSEIQAGDKWEHEIMSNLENSQIILLLISPDFLLSSFCTTREMLSALDLHKNGRTLVIPVIVRPLPYDHYAFDYIQALPGPAPTGTRAVTAWPSEDEAWTNVVAGIDAALGKALDGLLKDLEHCNIDLRMNRVIDLIGQDEIMQALKLLIDFCREFSPGRQEPMIKAISCKATYESFMKKAQNDINIEFDVRSKTVDRIMELLFAVRKDPPPVTA